MRVAILPSGALLAVTASGDDEASDGLSAAARARIARAFERGAGHAVLQLGAAELDAPLTPPLAVLRDLGGASGRPGGAAPLGHRRRRIARAPGEGKGIAEDRLSAVFGIELEAAPVSAARSPSPPSPGRRTRKR